jgi:hypothetical protein
VLRAAVDFLLGNARCHRCGSRCVSVCGWGSDYITPAPRYGEGELGLGGNLRRVFPECLRVPCKPLTCYFSESGFESLRTA